MQQHNLLCQARRDYDQDRHQKMMRFLEWCREVRTFQEILDSCMDNLTLHPEIKVLMAAEQYQILKSPKFGKKRKNIDTRQHLKPKYLLDRAQRRILLADSMEDEPWDWDL